MSEKLRSMRRTMAGRRRGRSAGGRIPVVTSTTERPTPTAVYDRRIHIHTPHSGWSSVNTTLL